MFKLPISLLAAMLFAVCHAPVYAALINTSVTGALQFNGEPSNLFDPVFDFVPVGYLNSAGTTVTISNSAVEFGFNDSANLITADFTDTQLTLSNLVEASGSNLPFTMTFTDAAFTGLTITAVSNSFPLTYSLNSTALTLSWVGGNVTAGQTFAATFNFASVPEPSTMGLLLSSSIAVAAFAHMRRPKTISKSIRRKRNEMDLAIPPSL